MGASATKDMDSRGLMGRARRIETGYLRVVRAVLAIAIIIGVLAFVGAPSTEAAADAFSGCDLTIVSDAEDRSGQSRDEVEDQLTQELAIKLKQFDECLERMESSQADALADVEAGSGAKSQASRAYEARQDQRRDQAARDSTAGTEVARRPTIGSQRATRPGSPRAGERYPRADERYPRTEDRYPRADERYPRADERYPRADERYPRTEDRYPRPDERYPTADERYPRAGTERGTAHQAGRPSGSVRTSPAEDDIARILREAAESETDPSRRAALWEEYENYVKNL